MKDVGMGQIQGQLVNDREGKLEYMEQRQGEGKDQQMEVHGHGYEDMGRVLAGSLDLECGDQNKEESNGLGQMQRFGSCSRTRVLGMRDG
jgi:hypothetical protein